MRDHIKTKEGSLQLRRRADPRRGFHLVLMIYIFTHLVWRMEKAHCPPYQKPSVLTQTSKMSERRAMLRQASRNRINYEQLICIESGAIHAHREVGGSETRLPDSDNLVTTIPAHIKNTTPLMCGTASAESASLALNRIAVIVQGRQ